MRTLQDYRDIYKEVARKLNITGDSVEILVQLLANATYISEMETASYIQESSLERATLVNSKIQHCMDGMYSVFRGRCPRIIIKFKPTKYFTFSMYEKIISSNNFGVYYLGYYDPSSVSSDRPNNLPLEDGFVYGPCTIKPAVDSESSVTIICLLSREVVDKSWTLSSNNTYYVDVLSENLSNDMWVKIGSSNTGDMEYWDVTRLFSDHILNNYIFDLTTTSYGSRLYVADIFRSGVLTDEVEEAPVNLRIQAEYFKYSTLESYNESELKKLTIKGGELVGFDKEFLEPRGYSEISKGICILSEVSRDDIRTIHYKVNRDRYANSIFRSNNDVGIILEEMYPEKVISGGTNFIFRAGNGNNSSVYLYYVPANRYNELTDLEIEEFIRNREAYYVTDTINIEAGECYTANFTIDIELYRADSVDQEIAEILKTYEDQFGIDLNGKIDEIKTLISKISNIKQIKGFDITYIDQNNRQVDSRRFYDRTGNILPNIYFKTEYTVNSIIQSKS